MSSNDSDRVQSFCSARDWDQFHSPDQLAIGLATESAELLALFRFKTQEQVRDLIASPQSRIKISDELADVYFFLLRFAHMNQMDLSQALEAKLAKNEAKYPVEKARGSNLKYDEL
ncbi:MAG TPA: nucleotide pyrophosphohydrolase [bacterium]|jgi:NTP pyrophosphatase (non-canonical NTP hydrolase)|nr:nucleotide pyrophosphohydrolase [bacterium]HXB96509.1 nucleotide pyrophosphohydrolase [bacterium]